MYFVTFHKWMKRRWLWLIAVIVAFVSGFFALNAYLRWEGIETNVALFQQKRLFEPSQVYFFVCRSTTERNKRILERMYCGIDSCVHWYFDFDGTEIVAFDDYPPLVPSPDEKKPEDYGVACEETTREYFHRFVPDKWRSS